MDGILYNVIHGMNTNFHDATDDCVSAGVHIVEENMHRVWFVMMGARFLYLALRKLSLAINS
jgi:hypothetical protein